MPAYESTLLIDAPQIAASLGVGRVLVKAENRRLGLPSFKILGASWATYRALVERLGGAEPTGEATRQATRLLRRSRTAFGDDGWTDPLRLLGPERIGAQSGLQRLR